MTVTRGPDSWQFFAFIFATVFALGITVLDDILEHHEETPSWARLSAKVGLFALSFYFCMLNNWVHNRLIDFLHWMVTEHYR